MRKKLKKSAKSLLTLFIVFQILFMPLAVIAESGDNYSSSESSSATDSDTSSDVGSNDVSSSFTDLGSVFSDGFTSNSSNNLVDTYNSGPADLSGTDLPEEPAKNEDAAAENDAGNGAANENSQGSDGDCYTVSITEVDIDGVPIETPGLVINGGDSGKATKLMFTFTEVGNSNIAVTTITIANGFFWEADFEIDADPEDYAQYLLIDARHDELKPAENWTVKDFEKNGDYVTSLTLYGDALFQGGWVSATLLKIITPKDPGIYQFDTAVKAIETFSDGSPIYDITVDGDGHTIGTMRYRDNNLAVGHDQPTLWVAGKEIKFNNTTPFQLLLDGADAYDVITIPSGTTYFLGNPNVQDLYEAGCIDINKSIYLRGTGEDKTTIVLTGNRNGGPGINVSGDVQDVVIRDMTIQQMPIPYVTPAVLETYYEGPNGSEVPWIKVTVKLIPFKITYSIDKNADGSDKYVDFNELTLANQALWIANATICSSYSSHPVKAWLNDNSNGPLNTSNIVIPLAIYTVDDYLVNISNVTNSFTMENTTVQGAGRLYHNFDLDRTLDALSGLGLGISDIGSILGLLQNPDDLGAWSDFIEGLDIDAEGALELMPEILNIIIDAYKWENAITGVNLNKVGKANLSNVTVEKFSRNGISFTDVQDIFMNKITVQKTGSHLGSAGIAFYGDVNNVSFGGGRISQAPIGINVGALSSHGLDLEWNYFNLGCLQFPYLSSINPANFTIRKVDFEQNLVGIMNLGGLVEHNGQIHYSPNFFTVDARCNNWYDNLFNTLGLVKSCGVAPECVKPVLPDKLTITITANNGSKVYDGKVYDGFSYHHSSPHQDYDFNLDGTVKYITFVNPEVEAKNVGHYWIKIDPESFNSLNYNLVYELGELNILKAPLTVTANNHSKTFDGVPFTGGAGVNFTGFVPGEDHNVLGGSLDYAGNSQGAWLVGNYSMVPHGYTADNYEIQYVNGVLVISAVSTGGGGGGGFDFGGFDFPFTPLTLPAVTPAAQPAALSVAPEAPLVEPGDYLVLPPEDPESELIALIDPEFIMSATAEELAQAFEAYELLKEYFEEFWAEMGDEEYAKHLLDLSAAWAALLAREATLLAEAGEAFDLDAVAEAYDLAMENYSKYGELLSEEQDQAFNAVLEAVAEVMALLAEEPAA